MPTTPIIDRRGVSVHLHSTITYTLPQWTVPASQVSQASGSMMPIRIGIVASIKVSSAQLLFTSFVKKGKGIDRAYSSQPLHWPGGALALLPT